MVVCVPSINQYTTIFNDFKKKNSFYKYLNKTAIKKDQNVSRKRAETSRDQFSPKGRFGLGPKRPVCAPKIYDSQIQTNNPLSILVIIGFSRQSLIFALLLNFGNICELLFTKLVNYVRD
jgi:hypothetical protein